MEQILISLFGGGTLDWEDISQTKYDWKEIFRNAEDLALNDGIQINDLYFSILEMAMRELLDSIEEYIDSANTTEELLLAEKLEDIDEEDFDLWANCLYTIAFIGTDDQAEIIQKLFENKIEEINNKIGFAEIQFN